MSGITPSGKSVSNDNNDGNKNADSKEYANEVDASDGIF